MNLEEKLAELQLVRTQLSDRLVSVNGRLALIPIEVQEMRNSLIDAPATDSTTFQNKALALAGNAYRCIE